jgi:hypothetical protein
MRLFCVLFLASLPVWAEGMSVSWPDLPIKCFVSGRPGTEADVAQGCAAFVIKGQAGAAGIPLDISVPQYALHIDSTTGKGTPVILIQAEKNRGIEVVGYKVIGSGEIGAALLGEMRLLGVSKPHGHRP